MVGPGDTPHTQSIKEKLRKAWDSLPPSPPPAQPDMDWRGRTWSSMYRLRPTWFGVVLETIVTESDGSKRWVRLRNPLPLHHHPI